MKVFVAGATGQTGRRIVNELHYIERAILVHFNERYLLALHASSRRGLKLHYRKK